jgi:rubrerythrin
VAKKSIKARELLSDIRAGMDDAGLMEKYGLSARGVLQALNRLIGEGLMSPSELVERRSLAKTVYMPVFTCPTCGDCHFEKVERCPRCGSRMKTLKEDKSDSSY